MNAHFRNHSTNTTTILAPRNSAFFAAEKEKNMTEKRKKPKELSTSWANTDYDHSAPDQCLWVDISAWLTPGQVNKLRDHLSLWIEYFEGKK